MGLMERIRQRIRTMERPAPRVIVALYLSWTTGARVSWSADIRYPARLRLGAGVSLEACTIICTGEVALASGVEIRRGAILDAQGGPISVGARSVVNPYCVVYGAGGLRIGQDVAIATHVVIIPANHRFDRLDVPIVEQGSSQEGVTVEDNVWLASHCVVLDGVTIGSGAVVAAGAVVSRSVEADTIVAGVPARVIGSRRAES